MNTGLTGSRPLLFEPDPERISRNRQRSNMATTQQQENLQENPKENPQGKQQEENQEEQRGNLQDNSMKGDEIDETYTGPIPDLYVPDLDNTPSNSSGMKYVT